MILVADGIFRTREPSTAESRLPVTLSLKEPSPNITSETDPSIVQLVTFLNELAPNLRDSTS